MNIQHEGAAREEEMNEQAKRLAAGLKDAGCALEDIERALRLQESGSDDELIHCLRKCRCELL